MTEAWRKHGASHGDDCEIISFSHCMCLVRVSRGKLTCDPLLMNQSGDDVVELLGTIVSGEACYLKVVTALNNGDEADMNFLSFKLNFEDDSEGATRKVINEDHQILAFYHGGDVDGS